MKGYHQKASSVKCSQMHGLYKVAHMVYFVVVSETNISQFQAKILNIVGRMFESG